MRDPDGANLDRIQIVKGWVDANNKSHERVYDIAWSDAGKRTIIDGALTLVGSTVNAENATYSNSIGAAQLKIVWTDPDFDARQRAFYYVRVLEIPTPRWTAYDAAIFGSEIPDSVKKVHQERAYSSPIWYAPGASQ